MRLLGEEFEWVFGTFVNVRDGSADDNAFGPADQCARLAVKRTINGLHFFKQPLTIPRTEFTEENQLHHAVLEISIAGHSGRARGDRF